MALNLVPTWTSEYRTTPTDLQSWGLRLSLLLLFISRGGQSISPEMRSATVARPLERTLGLCASFLLVVELAVVLLEAEKLANVP